MANCKYIKEQEIVSYNGGVDWQDVMPPQYRKGQLVEHDSEYCGEIDTIYRWRKLTGVYLCVDDMKYEKLILDESYDNGLSWYPAYPSEYTIGEAIGIDDDYCNDKFVGHYYMDITQQTGGTGPSHSCPSGWRWNGIRCVRHNSSFTQPLDPIKIVKCDGNPELTSADTKYYSSYPSNYKFYLFSAEIGKCVTSIAASAFTDSSALTYVYMADSVTSIGNSAFRGCTSLSGMNTTIPGVLNIPSGVTSIGAYAFQYCGSLSSVTIPNSVTSINGGAFQYCISLSSVTIPNSVTSIRGAAFNNCTSLTSITINAITPPLLQLGEYPFESTNDCPIYIPCESFWTYVNNERWSRYAGRFRGLPPCDTPFKWKATYNNRGEISACDSTSAITYNEIGRSNLKSVEIGDCVTSIGYEAFYDCSGLTAVTIGNNVTNIDENAFSYCSKLTSIDIPNSVTSIGSGAFAYCSGLISVVIPDSVTSIGGNAFYNCNGLTSATIGSGVTSIGSEAFQYCYGLTSITINAITPPILGADALLGTNNCAIFVQSDCVDAYKSSYYWRNYTSRIQPII